jgi:hypothetical protein
VEGSVAAVSGAGDAREEGDELTFICSFFDGLERLAPIE